MAVIDIETGDYEIDDIGIVSAQRLHAKRPNARLYGIHVGYNVAEALGGMIVGPGCKTNVTASQITDKATA